MTSFFGICSLGYLPHFRDFFQTLIAEKQEAPLQRGIMGRGFLISLDTEKHKNYYEFKSNHIPRLPRARPGGARRG
jgi:hypothetical protein